MANSLVSQGLQTQGQVSWDTIGSDVLNFSYGILARISRAGVDPYTLIVGTILGSRIPLSLKARDRVSEALTKCHTTGTFGRIVQIGFGLESIPMTLSKAQSGQALVAICATMSEALGVQSSARILAEVTRQLDFPEDGNIPSSSQWCDLIKACEGTLTQSNFSESLRWFLSKTKRFPKEEDTRIVDNLWGTDAQSIAEAFVAILRLVGDKEALSIQISGLRIAAWLATISVWLFDLRVSVVDTAKGSHDQTIFTNVGEGQEPQVYVLLQHELNGPIDNKIAIDSRTFFVDNFGRLARTQNTDKLECVVLDQLSWDECLRGTFDESFIYLADDPDRLGRLIGYAAHIYEAVCESHLSVANMSGKYSGVSIGATSSACPFTCCGIDYIRKAGELFPELTDAIVHARSAYKAALPEVLDSFGQIIELYCHQCRCRECGETLDRFKASDGRKTPQAEKTAGKTKTTPSLKSIGRLWNSAKTAFTPDDDLSTQRPPMQRTDSSHCLLTVAMGILRLIPLLDRISRPRELCLSRLGLRRWVEISAPVKGNPNGFDWTWLFEEGRNFGENMLGSAMFLFLGSSYPRDLNLNVGELDMSARSARGLCVYYDTLCEPTVSKERCNRVSIVPGRIEVRNRPYEVCTDHIPPQASAQVPKLKRSEVLQSIIRQSEATHSVQLCVEEDVNHLKVRYRFLSGQEIWPLSMKPRVLSDDVCRAWANIKEENWPALYCPRRGNCKKLDSKYSLTEVVKGRTLLCKSTTDETSAVVLRGLSEVSASFFFTASQLEDEISDLIYDVRFTGKDCLSCVLNQTMSLKRLRPAVIIV